MDIKPTQSGNTITTGAMPPALQRAVSQNWQISQIIDAVVTGKTPQGSLLLNIQGTESEVATPPPLPLKPGDHLQLQVLRLVPQPLFKIIGTRLAETTTQEVQKALRQVLPRQTPQGPLLANLAALANDSLNIKLPQQLQDMIQQIYRQVPELGDLLKPGGLREVLQQSGLYLEAALGKTLSQPQPPPDNQLRTSLLRLGVLLRQFIAEMPDRPASPTLTESATKPPVAPLQPGTDPYRQQQLAGYQAQLRNPAAVRLTPQPQAQFVPNIAAHHHHGEILKVLNQQVEGVLNRLHVHQLQQLNAENQLRPLWLFELPIRHEQGIDIFDLRIEPDEEARRRNRGRPGNWIVSLAFDLKGLGPIRARVTLQGQRISTYFWAEEEKTASLFNGYLDSLRSKLHQIGLDVGKLECRYGIPHLPQDETETGVVNEKA